MGFWIVRQLLVYPGVDSLIFNSQQTSFELRTQFNKYQLNIIP